jgi:hypothetical protein
MHSHASRNPFDGDTVRPVYCLNSTRSASLIGRPNSALRTTNHAAQVLRSLNLGQFRKRKAYLGLHYAQ